ncbi:MAG: YqgE/AlgH family protein [Alphaproteobacteria bacterium]
MSKAQPQSGYLEGQLLIAMPTMSDSRFARSLIYMCTHTAEGAMGLVVNRLLGSLTFPDLLRQLDIEPTGATEHIRVHFGGPMESGRGFVLHSTDYVRDGTLLMDDNLALTATVDILKEMAGGSGPRQNLLALGYAGWGPGQLEGEIQENAWLSVEPDDSLLFDRNIETKWERALGKLGVDHSMLSGDAGRA